MAIPLAKHTAAIFDRGGKNRIGIIEPLASVEWNRVRDDVSTAKIVTAQPSMKCLNLLKTVQANRHELVIFRGQERVWEGPITLISRRGDVVEIMARDVMHYAYRTAMHFEYDNSAAWDGVDFINKSAPVVNRALYILQQEFNRAKENPALCNPVYNVVPHIRTIRHPNISLEARTLRHTLPFSMNVYDELDSLAQYGGLDYTVVGRSIILNDTRVPIGKTQPVTESDFIGEVVVSSYGMDSFTAAYTVGDAGLYGQAGGIDPYYGELEYVEQMFDEDTDEPPTQNSLDNAAAYNMVGKLPVPTVVRLPDNTRVNPEGTLRLRDLVPGIRIPLRATLPALEVVQTQKLNTVKVTETDEGGEQISISMTTAPAGDLDV